MQAKIPSTLPSTAASGCSGREVLLMRRAWPDKRGCAASRHPGSVLGTAAAPASRAFRRSRELHHSPYHRYGRAEHLGYDRRDLVVLEVFRELSTITRLFLTTHAALHIRVIGSHALLTEEVAASVVFCRKSFPEALGKRDSPTNRLSNWPGGTSPCHICLGPEGDDLTVSLHKPKLSR